MDMGFRMLLDFTMGLIFMLLLYLIVYLIAASKDRQQHRVKTIRQEAINEKTKKAKALLNVDNE